MLLKSLNQPLDRESCAAVRKPLNPPVQKTSYRRKTAAYGVGGAKKISTDAPRLMLLRIVWL